MGSYWMVLFVHKLGQFIHWIASFILRYLFDGAHRGVPSARDPVLMMRAVELAAKIRKREVFCLSYCLAPHSFEIYWMTAFWRQAYRCCFYCSLFSAQNVLLIVILSLPISSVWVLDLMLINIIKIYLWIQLLWISDHQCQFLTWLLQCLYSPIYIICELPEAISWHQMASVDCHENYTKKCIMDVPNKENVNRRPAVGYQ